MGLSVGAASLAGHTNDVRYRTLVRGIWSKLLTHRETEPVAGSQIIKIHA